MPNNTDTSGSVRVAKIRRIAAGKGPTPAVRPNIGSMALDAQLGKAQCCPVIPPTPPPTDPRMILTLYIPPVAQRKPVSQPPAVPSKLKYTLPPRKSGFKGATADFQLPLTIGPTDSVTVNWGDGSPQETFNASSPPILHTYFISGNVTITVSGTASGFGFGGNTSYVGPDLITAVNQWGSMGPGFTSLSGAFLFASSLTYVPNNVPSTVTDMSFMFLLASNFNSNIGAWNVSNVTTMDYMFAFVGVFNQDISNWNVGNVKTMFAMFGLTSNFNQPIGKWNVANVTEMSDMLYGSTTFDQSLSSWNVTNVLAAQFIFCNCPVFTQSAKYPPFTNGLPAPGDAYYSC